jgi:hypothetical protein
MPCTENTSEVRFGKWLLKEHVCSFPHYNSGRQITDVQSPHITVLDNDMITVYKMCPRWSFEVILKNNFERNKWVAGLLNKIVRVMATAHVTSWRS